MGDVQKSYFFTTKDIGDHPLNVESLHKKSMNELNERNL